MVLMLILVAAVFLVVLVLAWTEDRPPETTGAIPPCPTPVTPLLPVTSIPTTAAMATTVARLAVVIAEAVMAAVAGRTDMRPSFPLRSGNTNCFGSVGYTISKPLG